jgi:two-component system chemotaxis family response regulator WspR
MTVSNDPKPPFESSLPIDEYAFMVLLVDDQALVGEAVRRAVAGHPDISYHYCNDPETALALAEQISPTVILQDLVMPGVDGLTLVRAYRASPRVRDVPIIVLSSREEPAVKGDAFATGANDYLVKLPDKIELLARIRYHSRAYLNQCQRDAAHRALRESQQQLMALNLELQRMTRSDGLTGLSNRRYLDEVLAMEWRRGARERSDLSVLMIDIDDFKKYNDTYGHVAGDEALRKVAEVLRKCLRRPADLAARFGGEEFTAVLPATSLRGAQQVGEQIRSEVYALEVPHKSSSLGQLSVSIGGAAQVPRHEYDFSILIETADRALYDAKRAGKDRVCVEQVAPP